jgi:type VI protein secretion system component Hcp
MEDAGGGQSSYTVLDIDGLAGDIEEINDKIATINGIIGNGIDGTTLTAAINDINDRLGSGFTSNHTVADALEELEDVLTEALTITLESSEDDPDYAKVYTLKQGGVSVGTINIPKDLVVKSGSLVHGYWSGNTFTEDEEGPDTALKLVLSNNDAIYINTKDLIDIYTAGDGIVVEDNEISVKLDSEGEPFLTVSANGLKLDGIQAAIDEAVKNAEYVAGDGISIAANTVKAVAAKFSAPGITNPITVEEDGIKFSKSLDCGYYDDTAVIAESAADINAIQNPSETDVFIDGDEAFGAVANKTFNSIEAANIEAASQVALTANKSIVIDDIDITGDKGSSNAFVLLNSPAVEVSNITVADGAKPYNVFEQTGSGKKLDSFEASNVKVNDVSLKHNVFNIYNLENDAVIKISDGEFNLDANNSNILRLANYANATGVTVEFENIDWTYENTPNAGYINYDWAGLIIYQPSNTDAALAGDLTKIQTWNFKFKNCKYNGIKVNANNFGKKNQVFYLYNIGGLGNVTDPTAEGITLSFE